MTEKGWSPEATQKGPTGVADIGSDPNVSQSLTWQTVNSGLSEGDTEQVDNNTHENTEPVSNESISTGSDTNNTQDIKPTVEGEVKVKNEMLDDAISSGGGSKESQDSDTSDAPHSPMSPITPSPLDADDDLEMTPNNSELTPQASSARPGTSNNPIDVDSWDTSSNTAALASAAATAAMNQSGNASTNIPLPPTQTGHSANHPGIPPHQAAQSATQPAPPPTQPTVPSTQPAAPPPQTAPFGNRPALPTFPNAPIPFTLNTAFHSAPQHASNINNPGVIGYLMSHAPSEFLNRPMRSTVSGMVPLARRSDATDSNASSSVPTVRSQLIPGWDSPRAAAANSRAHVTHRALNSARETETTIRGKGKLQYLLVNQVVDRLGLVEQGQEAQAEVIEARLMPKQFADVCFRRDDEGGRWCANCREKIGWRRDAVVIAVCCTLGLICWECFEQVRFLSQRLGSSSSRSSGQANDAAMGEMGC